MACRHYLKSDTYFDSVTLMLINGELTKLDGVEKAMIGMGTDYNIDSLKRMELFIPELQGAGPNDLIICVKAKDKEAADAAIAKGRELLTKRASKTGDSKELSPSSLSGGLSIMSDANMVLVSVPGAHAPREVEAALEKKMHVMLFSDNVGIDDEIRLKKIAVEKGLLLMGPDCGTAIINGVPLCFANAVRKGGIGLVAASGTGLQEVTSIIHRLGEGISQAIGVGGRDLSERVGGLMTRFAVKQLQADSETKVITLISKPPADSTLKQLLAELKELTKPVVIYFIGADPQQIESQGFAAAHNLEDAAVKSCLALLGESFVPPSEQRINDEELCKIKLPGRFLRGLYSGGTLCDEAQRMLTPVLGTIYSNTPVKGCVALDNVFESQEHSIIDLGDDDFTRGRAHPMIDPTYRRERLLNEFSDKDVGMIIFDIVLGYGSHTDMAGEMADAITKARQTTGREPFLAATILGTDQDPQNFNRQREALEGVGVKVFCSNNSLMGFVKACFGKRG